MKKLINFLTLFGSLGTLICCALPALLVSLGLGATVVSATSNFPQLIWISENKLLVFIFAGVMLALATFGYYSGQKMSCPIDADLAEACRSSKSFSKYILILSAILYLIGFSFAFILPYFF